MQLNKRSWMPGNKPIRTAAQTRRREIRLGIIGAIGVAILVAVSAVLYVVPIGKTTYTAYLDEAQSVKAGDDVRVAGIPVGSVESLTLHPDKVVMTFTVDDDVFVGDQTSLDIRMLTVAGGHYVAVFPAGTEPLGDNAITADRVRLPYSLVQAFQDASDPIREVDGTTLRESFAAIESATVDSPDGLRKMLGGVESLMDVLDKQNADVSKALALADEYVSGLESAKSELGRLVTKVNILETVLTDNRAEVKQAVLLLRSVIERLAALAPAWNSTLKPMAVELANALPALDALGAKLDSLVRSVDGLGTKMTTLITPAGGIGLDQSDVTITAPPLCVPVPGKAC
ncbi:MlaD family protein [Antrihabitans stalagmiti]|nr:MlaD family protein [Antrihabitans stalagmiti]